MTKYTDNLIPAMTSDTTPLGTVSASNYWGSRYPWHAFNHGMTYDIETDTWTGNGAGAWISYAFSNLARINKIEIFNAIVTNGNDNWSHVSVYGDDTNLIASFSRTDLSLTKIQTSQYILYTLELDNLIKYKKYTLKFDNTTFTYIYEIKMYSALLNKYLIRQNNQYYSIKNSMLTELGIPADDTQKEEWFNTYGVDGLKEALLTPDENGNKLIDALDDKFEVRMMVPKS
ncbi:hypothetical protein CLOSBL3_10561 [Clostridiaceae bacterium BL-3]|nr:hypothetical protein CLOSBL3_10561 [Clostridiaceae bacterium BL-3]